MIPAMPEPKTKRVLKFPIDPQHIKKVHAALLCCIDPRWWNKIGKNPISAIQAFADAKGWVIVPLTEAGGIKLLVSDDPKDAVRKEALLQRIEEDLEVLHHPEILALSVHRDCGANGYSKAFGNDSEKEGGHLYEDLWRAKYLLEEKFGSKARIELYIFDAEGVEEVSF